MSGGAPRSMAIFRMARAALSCWASSLASGVLNLQPALHPFFAKVVY